MIYGDICSFFLKALILAQCNQLVSMLDTPCDSDIPDGNLNILYTHIITHTSISRCTCIISDRCLCCHKQQYVILLSSFAQLFHHCQYIIHITVLLMCHSLTFLQLDWKTRDLVQMNPYQHMNSVVTALGCDKLYGLVHN